MAGALEFSKFVLAAYLHQRWSNLNWFLKSYLSIAIVILSIITSMGIFGFLSNAYQSASGVLEQETLKLETLRGQEARNTSEVARYTRLIDEIPANRVTKKMQARAEYEPQINSLTKQSEVIAKQIGDANLKILEVKQKVGPLIYISKAFKIDIDDVVKYLILILVSVFDPLAICLVIASSESIMSRRRGEVTEITAAPVAATAAPAAAMPEQTSARKEMSEQTHSEFAIPAQPAYQSRFPADHADGQSEVLPQPPVLPAGNETVAAAIVQSGAAERIIHMRFAEEQDKKAD